MDNYTGRVLGGRYVLRDIIGVGGMAVVYRAYDNVDNKIVAVKILKDEFLANEDFRKRFRNESRAVSVLSHPNIVKVFDVSLGEKLQYIVMEYIDGITLKQYIEQKGVLDWHEALDFTSQILKALQHAHERGVIHRDIKPQNIMLLKDNKTIKVADFGIARFDNRTDTKTMTDSAIGSVHYISPEQARGDFTDNKTDIYSVGVVLYEMITGQLPFQSDSAVSVAIMQLQKEAVMPRKINPSIPVGIEQITMRAMQKSPRDRYQSAAEMLLDIDEFKRNPATKSDYNYFVDGQPTKYVAGAGRRKMGEYSSGKPLGSEAVSDAGYTEKTVITKEPDVFDEEDEALTKKNYTVPVLFAIILAIIVVIIGVAWYFFASSDEVDIPQFVGKYVDDIKEEKPYKYFFDHDMIESNLVYTTDYKDGYIISQSVEAGSKMQITHTTSSVIRLNVAYTSESMSVPEIEKGSKLQDARSKLQKMGFKVKSEGIVDTTVDESTVIKTDPVSGTNVAYGSTITIYYAVHDADKVAVPNVVGDRVSAAKSELEGMGFKVNVQYKESTQENAGLVLSQSVAADTTVIAKNTEITLVVGATNEKTTSVTITLPDLKDYGDVYESVYVYVGGSLYKTYNSIKLDGSTNTVELGGTGDTSFKIYVGTQVVCTGKVDFTSSSPTVSEKTTTDYKYTGKTTAASTTTGKVTATATTAAPVTQKTYKIPSYSGKTYAEYFTDLANAGFDNIDKKTRASDTVPEGQVIYVSSSKSEYTESEVADALITVYVSTGTE